MPISKRPSSRRFPTHLAFVVTFISLSFDEILTHQCRSLLFLPSRTEQGPVVRIGTGVGLLQCTLEDGAHGQLIGVGGFGYSHAHTLAHTHTLCIAPWISTARLVQTAKTVAVGSPLVIWYTKWQFMPFPCGCMDERHRYPALFGESIYLVSWHIHLTSISLSFLPIHQFPRRPLLFQRPWELVGEQLGALCMQTSQEDVAAFSTQLLVFCSDKKNDK